MKVEQSSYCDISLTAINVIQGNRYKFVKNLDLRRQCSTYEPIRTEQFILLIYILSKDISAVVIRINICSIILA